jgi:hypothetical protein
VTTLFVLIANYTHLHKHLKREDLVQQGNEFNVSIPFEQTLLPNLTRVKATYEWFPILIPGRPVKSIDTIFPDDLYGCHHYVNAEKDVDTSFFALSTGPLQKLSIHFNFLYPKPASLLLSTFPFLMHLVLSYGTSFPEESESAIVRETSFYYNNKRILSKNIIDRY